MPVMPEMDSFKNLLSRKGLKFTHERKQLLDEVLQLKNHFDADKLADLVKEKGLRISRDTVYRTLPLLLECGVVQKSVGDGRREYFERTSVKGHHDHMVCIECGKIIEFTSDKIESLQDEICESYGFKLVFHDHRLFGICEHCQKKLAKAHPTH
ncbi:MAG: transcriptional repressor [Bdellovibrionales bacterium]|nr:transcriptional repressor [Bdellovibrionales bacterium]